MGSKWCWKGVKNTKSTILKKIMKLECTKYIIMLYNLVWDKKYIPLWSSVLAPGLKVQKWAQNEVKGESKTKIDNIEENNKDIVTNLHQYVRQVGTRKKQ